MTDMERVWVRIKHTGREYARRGHVPSRIEARVVILDIAEKEGVVLLPPEAMQYLVRELIAFSADQRVDV